MGAHAGWEFEEGEEIHPGRVVLKAIGGGNRYEVCLVWDESLYALGVAKLIRPDQVEEEKALRDLEREVEALESLAHPTLVRCFDAVVDGPHPHVLIEHLEGPSLRRLIRRDGAIGLEQLLPLAAHVAGALQYMANSGYVHLDVKPDNIVMGVPPRLIDLSIARTLERAARTSGPLGTDPYMAPEQCVEAPAPPGIGPAADAWGLGATLFHAAGGEKPFPPPVGRRGRRALSPALRATRRAACATAGAAPRPRPRAARPGPGGAPELRRGRRPPRAADRGAAPQGQADATGRDRRLIRRDLGRPGVL